MFQEMSDKPFIVTNSIGKSFGRYETYSEAEKNALIRLQETKWQERVFIKWFDLEYGMSIDEEILVA